MKIFLSIIIALLSAPMSLLHSADADQEQRLKDAIAALDHEFDDCFKWWADIYDPQSGGFFYSLSSKRSDKYGPFIEASSKAIHVLEWTGIVEQCSPEFKAKGINYFQTRQNADTGFFRDPEYKDQYDHKMLSRALGMSMNALETLGGKALHAHPMDRLDDNATAQEHYKHVSSQEELIKWLDSLPWEKRVWTVGGRLRAQLGVFKRVEEPLKTELLKASRDYIYKRQLDNGYFGTPNDHWTSRLSGSYKIAAFLDGTDQEIPRLDKMLETTLKHLFESDYNNVIVVYNTANMLNIIHRNSDGLDKELQIRVIEQCAKLLSQMHAKDGGFVTNTGHKTPSQNGIRLADDVVESNTNATGLAHKARMLLLSMALDKDAPHPHPRQDDFVKGIEAQLQDKQTSKK